MEIPSQYHNTGDYVFHTTRRENVDSILDEGVRHDRGPAVGADDILDVLDELGYDNPFPFDRRTATYCHVDANYIENTIAGPDDDTPFSGDKAVIVIDTTELPTPAYLADMSIITDLIDYRYGGADVMLHTDTPDETVTQYQNSITPIASPADIREHTPETDNHTELVVDGNIPANAIVDALT